MEDGTLMSMGSRVLWLQGTSSTYTKPQQVAPPPGSAHETNKLLVKGASTVYRVSLSNLFGVIVLSDGKTRRSPMSETMALGGTKQHGGRKAVLSVGGILEYPTLREIMSSPSDRLAASVSLPLDAAKGDATDALALASKAEAAGEAVLATVDFEGMEFGFADDYDHLEGEEDELDDEGDETSDEVRN